MHGSWQRLALLALGLGLAACSQAPEDVQAPDVGITPQFGTADDDIGADVALSSTGRIYALVNTSRKLFEDDGNYAKTFLRRYDRSGNLIFNREVEATSCPSSYECDFDSLHKGQSLEATSQGNLYAQYTRNRIIADRFYLREKYVEVYSSNGQELSRIALGYICVDFETPYNDKVATAVDGGGNVYSTFETSGVYDPSGNCLTTNAKQNLTKHSASGSLLWERAPNVGLVYGVTVNASGDVYVIGSKGMARYTSSGTLTWTKTGSSYAVNVSSKIVASGSNLYVRTLNTIRKYDSNGSLVWSKPQSGLSGVIAQDLTTDPSGNVYLSGKFAASSSNRDVFSRKLNAQGATVWTKTFGTPQYDDARGIATLNGSELYLTGETQGALAQPNQGGLKNRDGYLVKLDGSGNQVWVR